MTAEITYTGALHTNATHVKSGNVISTDAPTDNKGKGEAFSPTDLVATALGSCILTIMGISADTQGISIEGATCKAKKFMASNPRRIARIEITIKMPKKNYSDKEKKVLEKAAHYCPVARSLHPDLEEIIKIHW